MKLHHIGIACKKIETTLSFIRKTHKIKNQSDIVFDNKQNAHMCMVTVEQGPDIELISGEQVEKFIKRNITNYHICYEVDDIDNTVENYVKHGAMILSEAKPAILFNNRKVAFVFSPIGIIEFLQK